MSKRIEREVLVHSSFQHPHVVEFKGVFLTKKHLGVVMEYASGGDLFNYVNDNGCLEVRALAMHVDIALVATSILGRPQPC